MLYKGGNQSSGKKTINKRTSNPNPSFNICMKVYSEFSTRCSLNAGMALDARGNADYMRGRAVGGIIGRVSLSILHVYN